MKWNLVFSINFNKFLGCLEDYLPKHRIVLACLLFVEAKVHDFNEINGCAQLHTYVLD